MFAIVVAETQFGIQWAGRKRDLDLERARQSGFVLPTDELAIVHLPDPAKCDGCEGVNEDWVVEYGQCDICGLPVSRNWPQGLK